MNRLSHENGYILHFSFDGTKQFFFFKNSNLKKEHTRADLAKKMWAEKHI